MDQLQQQQQQQALPFTSSGTAAAPTMGGGVITVAEVKRELAVLGYDPEAVPDEIVASFIHHSASLQHTAVTATAPSTTVAAPAQQPATTTAAAAMQPQQQPPPPPAPAPTPTPAAAATTTATTTRQATPPRLPTPTRSRQRRPTTGQQQRRPGTSGNRVRAHTTRAAKASMTKRRPGTAPSRGRVGAAKRTTVTARKRQQQQQSQAQRVPERGPRARAAARAAAAAAAQRKRRGVRGRGRGRGSSMDGVDEGEEDAVALLAVGDSGEGGPWELQGVDALYEDDVMVAAAKAEAASRARYAEATAAARHAAHMQAQAAEQAAVAEAELAAGGPSLLATWPRDASAVEAATAVPAHAQAQAQAQGQGQGQAVRIVHSPRSAGVGAGAGAGVTIQGGAVAGAAAGHRQQRGRGGAEANRHSSDEDDDDVGQDGEEAEWSDYADGLDRDGRPLARPHTARGGRPHRQPLFSAPKQRHTYLGPGYIHARPSSAGPRRQRTAKTDPVARFAKMQAQWQKDATRQKIQRARRRRRPVSAGLGVTMVSPGPTARRRPRTSRTPPFRGGGANGAFVVPTDKRRDRLRLEVRARMLAAQYDAPVSVQRRSRPLQPSPYKIPSDNPRKGLRWATRVRMMT